MRISTYTAVYFHWSHYLLAVHSKGIIHGDLSGANVLINHDGVACLTDFGLSHLKSNAEQISHITATIGGTLRWRAMELVPPDNTNLYENFLPILTFKSDVYSMASVTLQVSFTQTYSMV